MLSAKLLLITSFVSELLALRLHNAKSKNRGNDDAVVAKACWSLVKTAQQQKDAEQIDGKDSRTVFRFVLTPSTHAITWETYEELVAPKARTLVIFDWDDTLFPSSLISAAIPSRFHWLLPRNEELLLNYDQGLAKVLEPLAAIAGPTNRDMQGDILTIAISSWNKFCAQAVDKMPQTKAMLERLGFDISEAPVAAQGVDYRGYYVAHYEDKHSHHKWFTHRLLKVDGSVIAVGDTSGDHVSKDVKLDSQHFYGIQLPYEEALKRKINAEHPETNQCTDVEVWQKLRDASALTPENSPYNDGDVQKLLRELSTVVEAVIRHTRACDSGLAEGAVVMVESLRREASC